MGDESLARFQVWLRGTWMDYDAEEDRLCKRAYFAGRPLACYSYRGCMYEVDFHALEQRNLRTGKARRIRPPGRRTTLVSAAAVTALPAAMSASSETKSQVARVVVPPGAPGATIRLPHPAGNGEFLVISVPPEAREGQVMLVPVQPASCTPWLADAAHKPFVDQVPPEDEAMLLVDAPPLLAPEVVTSAPGGAIKIKAEVTEPVAQVPSIYRAARGATLPANFGHGVRGSPIPDVDLADDACGLDAAPEAQDAASPRYSSMMMAAMGTPEVTLAIPPVVVAAIGAEFSQSLTPEALAPFLNGHALPLPPDGTLAHTRHSSAMKPAISVSSGRTARLLSMLPSVTLASDWSDDAKSCPPMDATRTSSSYPPFEVSQSCPPAIEIAKTAANTLASDQVASLLQGFLEADAVRGDDLSFVEPPLSARTEPAHTSPVAKGHSKSAPAELEAAFLASSSAATEESDGDSVADDASIAEQEEVHSEHPPSRPVKEPLARGPISISGKAGAAAVLALGGIGATGGEACAETGHDLGQAIAVEAEEFVEWADDVADNIGDYIMGLF